MLSWLRWCAATGFGLRRDFKWLTVPAVNHLFFLHSPLLSLDLGSQAKSSVAKQIGLAPLIGSDRFRGVVPRTTPFAVAVRKPVSITGNGPHGTAMPLRADFFRPSRELCRFQKRPLPSRPVRNQVRKLPRSSSVNELARFPDRYVKKVIL